MLEDRSVPGIVLSAVDKTVKKTHPVSGLPELTVEITTQWDGCQEEAVQVHGTDEEPSVGKAVLGRGKSRAKPGGGEDDCPLKIETQFAARGEGRG